MGRYSSVQAYTDQQNTRTTSYEQEKGSASGVKTEKVHNPYGSTAGAGSGEFHVYRHARAREQERINALDESELQQKEEMEFQNKIKGWKTEEEERLEKKRKKRARGKASKIRKKNLKLIGVKFSNDDDDDEEKIDKNEFEYIPMKQREEDQMNKDNKTKPHEDEKKNDDFIEGASAIKSAQVNKGGNVESEENSREVKDILE